jgi:hypothetical protein
MAKGEVNFGNGLDDSGQEIDITPVPSSDVRLIAVPANEGVLLEAELIIDQMNRMDIRDKRAFFLKLRDENPDLAKAVQARQQEINRELNEKTGQALEHSAYLRESSSRVIDMAGNTQAQIAEIIVDKTRRSA